MINIKVLLKIIFATGTILMINSNAITICAQNQDTTFHYLNNEDKSLDFSSQNHSTTFGGVSVVSGDTLKKSPVANLSQTFSGRFSGLFTYETNSTLAHSATRLNIRGLSRNSIESPAVVIDGILYTYGTDELLRNFILPEEIETISILKDASSQALYGGYGANGVIVITTKKGEVGPLKINAHFDQSFQQTITKPFFINSAEYAELRNQAAYNDGLGPNYYFRDSEIDRFAAGDNDLYPNNNWYNLYMKDFALMQRAFVNMSGGSEWVRYFTNIGVMHQGGQFLTEQSEYNSNNNNIRANLRSNIDANLTNNLTAFLKLNANIFRHRLPGNLQANTVYQRLFNLPPTLYGPLTPEITDPETNEVLGGQVIITENENNSVFGMINRSGFSNVSQVDVASQFGLTYDLSFLTEGLNATGLYGYRSYTNNNLRTLQNYERWIRVGGFEMLDFEKIGAELNTPLAYSKIPDYYYTINYQGDLNYKRDFNKHGVTWMAFYSYQKLERNRDDSSTPWNIPTHQIHTGFQGTYTYDQRYFVKFDAGYAGYDYFSKGNRFIFTPAVAGAWMVSRESFMEQVDILSNLNVRASYGKTGNIHLFDRYGYLDNITFSLGGPIGDLRYVTTERGIGNPNIGPEVSTKQNYGIDIGLLNTLSISFDLFNERMENMVVDATERIPRYQGVLFNMYPLVNSGIFENKGYEVEVNFNKTINNDFNVYAGGFVTHAQNTVIYSEELTKGTDYAFPFRTEGFPYGQNFGYLVDYSNGNGFYNSLNELNASNLEYSMGTPRVGDLIYQDLNNDGIIDERDMAPIGSGAIPKYYYGFSGGVQYKGFSVNFLLQGVADWKLYAAGTGIWEYNIDGIFGSLHRNAWTEDRYKNGETITAPALSTERTTSHQNNDYYYYDRSYLRLKQLEIGYTLPANLTNAISANDMRIYFIGHNLFTWDNMKSKDFGPEDHYHLIPVYRIYNIGLTINF